jgi:hypothetical protein
MIPNTCKSVEQRTVRSRNSHNHFEKVWHFLGTDPAITLQEENVLKYSHQQFLLKAKS